MASQVPAQQARDRSTTNSFPRWKTVVWDDPINLRDYVTGVFQRHFRYARPQAEELMRQVRVEGRAVVSRGLRERVEADVLAMHSYGLHATMERDE